MDRYWFRVERISAAIHKPGSFKLLAVDYLRRKKRLSLNNKKKKVWLYCLEWQAEFLFPGSRPEGPPDHDEGLGLSSQLALPGTFLGCLREGRNVKVLLPAAGIW